MNRFVRVLLVAAAFIASAGAQAGEVQVAVASNFAAPAKALAALFSQTTGHTAKLSVGATGAFYSQIKNGAPFDVLMAADDVRPALLVNEGLAVPSTRFTYAVGQLVLWSPKVGQVDAQGTVLRQGSFNRLAIANPKLAPYGAAAVEVLNKLGVYTAVAPKLVTGDGVSQAYSYVISGNADLGFVALSQVQDVASKGTGSVWVVPAHLYTPIKQDAVVLKRAEKQAAALAWVKLLQSTQGQTLIRSFGYTLQ